MDSNLIVKSLKSAREEKRKDAIVHLTIRTKFTTRTWFKDLKLVDIEIERRK